MRTAPEINVSVVEDFLDKAIPLLRLPESMGYPCPRCGTHVLFPVVARPVDIEAFQKLIRNAIEYLRETGITG